MRSMIPNALVSKEPAVVGLGLLVHITSRLTLPQMEHVFFASQIGNEDQKMTESHMLYI
jgi:hypothetical protein